ncbi:MAG: high frequency lysogenization protein HflD [Arenimonas sp.]
MKDRALALAALLQAVEQVNLMANQGQAQTEPLATCINSLFVFDADQTEHIYGNRHQLKAGLKCLSNQLLGEAARDNTITRIALNVLHLERQFNRNPQAMQAVHAKLQDIKMQAETSGATHPDILAALGALYAEKVSPLGPKIMVQGNPVYLAQAQVVSEVRAALLAAVRAAVLWRQLGGSYWDFFLSRRQLNEATRGLLGQI